MTQLFVVTIDVGSDAPVGTVARLLIDVDALCDAAGELAVLTAKNSVSELIAATRRIVSENSSSVRALSRLEQALNELAAREQEIRSRAAHAIENMERQGDEWAERQRAEITQRETERRRRGRDVEGEEDLPVRVIREIVRRSPEQLGNAVRSLIEGERKAGQLEERAQIIAEREIANERTQIAAQAMQAISSREAEELGALNRELAEVLSVSMPLSAEQARRALWPVIQEAAQSREEIATADHVSNLVPEQPYRFRSVRYENPLVLEILSGMGFASLSLAYLLKIVRDWSADRRRSLALAADAENQMLLRTHLREIMAEQASAGQLPLTADIINALLSGQKAETAERLAGTIERLAAYSPDVNQKEIGD